jgi:integrase
VFIHSPSKSGEIYIVVSSFDSFEVTLQEYASMWLDTRRRELRPKTVRSYEQLFRIHIAPMIGQIKLRELGRADIKQVLIQKRNVGLSRNTVRLIRACLSVICSEARDEGLIIQNPVSGLRRPGLRREIRFIATAKALTEAELARFLTTAESFRPDYYPLFLTLARTGCRPGEALALCWSDINFDQREILLERAFSCGQLGPTKTGRPRYLDMSLELASVLMQLYQKRQAQHGNRGELSKWVFLNSAGKPIDENRPRRVFAKVLARAGLSNHTVYDLRHTFATLHLAKGHPITYVSAQLGHASPSTTLRWYAHWVPTKDKRYADSLDGEKHRSVRSSVAFQSSDY